MTSKKKAPVVFESVSHPVLETVDPADAVRFMREREVYEAEIAERQDREGTSISAASYRISVDPIFLRSVHAMGCFDSFAKGVSVDDLTEAHIKQFIENIANNAQEKRPNSAMIEEALRGLRIKNSIINPKARVYQLALEFDMRMAGIGSEGFREQNPKKAIELLTNCMHPPALKAQLKCDLEYITEIRKNWKLFLQHAAEQAEHIQRGTDSASRVTRTEKEDPKVFQKRVGKQQRTHKPDDPGGKQASASRDKSDSKKKPLPKCLNEECDELHYLKDCKNTSIDKKKELLKKFRDSKNSERDRGTSKAVRATPMRKEVTNPTLFSACFAGKVENILCTDIGSDINLLPPSILRDLQASNARMTVVKFKQPRSYGLAVKENSDGTNVSVTCDCQVTLDVQLFIRHGSTLWLRNITWYVATKDVPEPLLGRPVLYALGLDAAETLAAASEANDGSIDIGKLSLDPDDHPTGSIARIMAEQGLFHHSGSMVDATDDDTPEMEFGIDTKEELSEAFEKIIVTAKSNECPDIEGLRRLLKKHSAVFRCKLGPDPPARVEPMKVRIIPGSKPVKAKLRHYSTEQRKVICDFMNRAVEYGFMRKNTNATWAAAPLLIPKPKKESGEKAYRVTFDHRPVNAVTIAIIWPLPHIDSELSDFRGMVCFALVDFCSGYWQLPEDEESQELHSVVTPIGLFTPTRTTQGGRNSAANFQSRVEPCFSDIRENLKAWLDDFILHARSCAELYHVLDRFFTICAERNLFVSAKKSTLFTRSVKWCGRVIDKEGMRMDPRNLEGIVTSSPPQTGDELSQFINCAQWMSNNIPDFSARVQPLRDILELAYDRAGKRSSKAISKINLFELAWGSEHDEAMRSLQGSLKKAATLAHYDPTKSICIYTDASDRHWAAVITQCEKSELHEDQEIQKHEPLAFLGSEFKDAARNWSTIEKEGFAIFSVFKRMDYLLMGSDNTHVYTDHRNLLYIFHPTALEPTLGRHVVSKLQRWALFLSQFAYHIEHVRGDKNIMADMMTRWYKGYRGKKETPVLRRVRERPLEEPEENSDTLCWPKLAEIRVAQEKSKIITDRPANGRKIAGIFYVNGKSWIPADAHSLQMRILVLGHCGPSGHRGSDATASIIKERHAWRTLKEDCKEFIVQCLHCVTAESSERIPRPLSETVHGEKPNDVVHFDYLYMGNSTEGFQYTLLLKDDFSSYCWIVPCERACADEAANAIRNWVRTFTAMNIWVSDQGSHFKNELLEMLAKHHSIHHHFTVAYTPWANGTVERLCREVLRATRSLLSENKYAPEDWPSVINCVQTAINAAPVKRLGPRPDGTMRTPLEVMTGIRPNRNTADSTQNFCVQSLKKEDTIKQLQNALDEVHRDVKLRAGKERQRARDIHNAKTRIRAVNFTLGDFVMVRRASTKGHKLSFKWVGPRKVVQIVSDSTYVVETLLTTKRETVHFSRLRHITTAADGSIESFTQHAAQTEAIYDTVKELLSTKKIDGVLHAEVSWATEDDKRDVTWQPFSELWEDVPELVRMYCTQTRDVLANTAYKKHTKQNAHNYK